MLVGQHNGVWCEQFFLGCWVSRGTLQRLITQMYNVSLRSTACMMFAAQRHWSAHILPFRAYSAPQVSSFIRDHLPNIVRKRLNDSMTPDDALASSFCSVNESMEAAPDDRGKGPPPCSG